MNQGEQKPEMMHKEASFHTATAGTRAAKEAGEKGNDPDVVGALGEAAAGGVVIGGVTFQRPSIKSNYAINQMNKLFKEGIGNETNTGLFLFAFANPGEAHRLACVQKTQAAKEDLVKEADALMLELEFEEPIAEAREWCQEAYARLLGVKKQSTSSTPKADEPESDSMESSAPETAPADPAG